MAGIETLNRNPLRRCWVEIDLSALRHNSAILKARVGPKTGLMAVIKADAYGHGLEAVAGALFDMVDWFCVANVSEALRAKAELQEKCPPLLLLSPLTPDEYEAAIANGFSCTSSSRDEVARFGAVAEKLGKNVKLHAAADTGMGRMGASVSEWRPMIEAVIAHPFCELEGVGTHFPNADEDAAFTRDQIARFRELTTGLDCEIHLANSAGIIDFSDAIDFATLARPGLSLYGVSPECENKADLRPALSMKSRVTLVREVPAGTPVSYGSTFTTEKTTMVASIAAGYGDGYPRHVSGRGAEVLIGGRRCALLGRVTMDQIVVDVSHLEKVAAGDEVILIGETISAAEIATKAGTIAWEIFTGITNRVERIYI